MSIRVSCELLNEILELTPPEQNILLIGKHGIGKSQILEKYFTTLGQKVVILFLGQMSDPGDLIGLPHLNEETGKTEFMLPFWFPSDEKPVVLFLDELNRARPEVLQTIMDLTLNKKLSGKSLPKGSRIISAINEGEEYQLTELDPALISRFNIYNFCPTVQEWLLWAQKNGIDERIIDFISENTNMLDGEEFKKETQELEKTPDRRAWENVSNILCNIKQVEPFHKQLIGGIVGAPAAAKFFLSLNDHRLLSAKEILLGDFDKLLPKIKSYKTTDLAVLNESFFRFIETKNYCYKNTEQVSANLEQYFDFLSDNNLREAQAHFINLYSSSTYPSAIVFIMSEIPKVYKKILNFVESI